MNSILLIPGISDFGRIFEDMKKYFSVRHYDVHTLDIVPNDGSISILQASSQVEKYLEQFSDKSFVLIGFSMGGIIARYYVQKVDQGKQVEKLITIGAPHQGTLWAYLSQKPGVVDMRFDSAVLHDLNSNLELFKHIPFLCLWTPLDSMVVPATSSRLSGVQCQKVWTLTHPGLIYKKKTFQYIEKFLNSQ